MQKTHSDKDHLSQKIDECSRAWIPFYKTFIPSYDQIKNVILPILHINTNPMIKKRINYEQINLNSVIENQPEYPTIENIQQSIQKLLEILTYGYDINYTNGRPLAIEYAATKRLDLLCTYLLSCGSKLPETPNSLCFRSLCRKLLLQCENDHPLDKIQHSLAILSKYSILPNFKDNDGNTCLHYAILNNNKKTARALLKAGASTEIRNAKGQAPLHLAIEIGNNELKNLLLKHGAYIEVHNSSGQTPLFLANDSKAQ
jgi:hypothetical protein